MQFVEITHPKAGTGRVAAGAVKHLGPGWTVVGEVPDPTLPPPPPPPFDPSEHTVAEVTAYLDYATPEERDRVIAAEQDGKARAGIVGS